jgi:hypothetical protein
MNSGALNVPIKISEILSFLDIASAINIISEMNCNILRKEFVELDLSIKESIDNTKTINRQINLSDFFERTNFVEEANNHASFKSAVSFKQLYSHKGQENTKGHTSIGVQKGSTLLRALSKIGTLDKKQVRTSGESFDMLKKQRRDEIINTIQKKGGNATITDIKNEAHGSLASCGEKTLQRELLSMTKDGVLNKTGEKRWSRYFLKN